MFFGYSVLSLRQARRDQPQTSWYTTPRDYLPEGVSAETNTRFVPRVIAQVHKAAIGHGVHQPYSIRTSIVIAPNSKVTYVIEKPNSRMLAAADGLRSNATVPAINAMPSTNAATP